MQNVNVRRLITAFGFCTVYAAVFKLTNVLAYSDLTVSPWNPETGLTFAAGAAWGWPGIAIAFVARLLSLAVDKPHQINEINLVSASIHAVMFAAPAAMFRQTIRDISEHAVWLVSVLLVFAGGTSLASAILQLLAESATSRHQIERILPSVATLAIGDFIGLLTVAPLFLLPDVVQQLRSIATTAKIPALIGFLVIAAISFAVFGLDSTDHFKVFYLVFLPVMFVAIAGGFVPAVLAILASDICMMAIIYTRGLSVSTATELQFFMATLAITGLFLGSLVADRRRLERQLAQSHSQLQTSQSALLQATRHSLVGELAAALSHELSQPLSSARSYIRAAERLLAAPKRRLDEVRKMVRDAVTQVDSAAELIKETRALIGKGDMEMSPVNISSTIDLCSRLVEAEMKAAHIRFRTNLKERDLIAIANRTQIQQVMLNLMRNSIDAIASGPKAKGTLEIEIGVADRGEMILITVSDDGPGVPEAALPNLFMPFNTSKPAGLGLGLSLCRNIIIAHGGTIWLDEKRDGKTRFHFTLRRSIQRNP